MASIYREKYRRPLPEGAVISERRGKKIARWVDERGRAQVAELEKDGKRVVFEYENWFARYRDASGQVRRVSTGCRDEQAARQVLANLVSEMEKVKSGIMTHDDARAGAHADVPLARHVEDYLTHLRACERCEEHIEGTGQSIARVANDCGFERLRDLQRVTVERWLLKQAVAGMGARTRNTYRIALVAFGNWCLREARLLNNPLAGLPKANEAVDRRRERRALTLEEIGKLLKAAEERPLHEKMLIRRGKHKGTLRAKINERTKRAMVRLGRDRAMFYRIAIYTGLRAGELASRTLADLQLDASPPYLTLDARHDKARRGARQPLPDALVQAIRSYLAIRLKEAQEDALRSGKPVPAALAATERLTPEAPVVRVFDRDLKMAGITKKDESKRTVDIHSLRHTFGTLLARSGAAPRTAMELMRHSDIRLTTNIYQHLELVDTAGAVNQLPVPKAEPAARSTGTDAVST
jgi:integrase